MPIEYDEIGITTGREVLICRKYIKKFKKKIMNFENLYSITTEEFLKRINNKDLNKNKDFISWHESYTGLKNWEERLKEYKKFI